MQNPCISVIVPVYNTQDFLKKCLDSLLNQTISNFEVIIVDDGSTDKSREIINSYCDEYDIFKAIYIKNSGVSCARNEGLKAAKGEFIAFVDSDDFVSPVFLETLYKEAKKTNADIVNCNYFIYNFNSNKNRIYPFKLRANIYFKPKILRALIYDCRLHYYIWNKLWKKSLITENNLKFNSRCFEDTDFSVKAFYFSKSVAVIDDPLYYYVKHKDSLVSFIEAQKINDYLKALFLTRKFLEEQNDFYIYKNSFLIHSLRILFTTLKFIIKLHVYYKNFNSIINNISECLKAIINLNSKKMLRHKNINEEFNIIKIFEE